MAKVCFLSDFDGTITVQDSLYNFFDMYAPLEWKIIEKDWEDGKINSMECLRKEFALFHNLEPKFLDDYIYNHVQIDDYFCKFITFIQENNYDFFIVSDGLDYFISRVLTKYNLTNIRVITNHAEFLNGKFEMSFPNAYSNCPKQSGTCKCNALNSFKNNYDKIFYFSDGTSDFCVADKPDYIFAKSKLENYCHLNKINYFSYNNFNDILVRVKKILA